MNIHHDTNTWNFNNMSSALDVTPIQPRISWHMFDISQNYINERINWTDNIIELKDSKQIICYSVIYYKTINVFTPVEHVTRVNNGLLDIEAIREYFKLDGAGFGEIILPTADAEIIEMCELTPESFIIMPICNTQNIMYIGIYNKNRKYGEYLASRYSAPANITKMFNTLDVPYGLQTHTTITGIKQATSFNLFKAIYMSSITKFAAPAAAADINPCKAPLSEYKYKFGGYNKITLGLGLGPTDNFELPIIALFDSYNYFPRLQVVWHTSKIFLNLPGIPPPNNTRLLEANKVLAVGRCHDIAIEECGESIPKIMYANRATKSKQRPICEWLHNYNKYCGSENTHYTNLNKVLNAMNKLKLEVGDLASDTDT